MIIDKVKELKEIRNREKLDVTDGVLFENAIKLYISEKIGKQKSHTFAKPIQEKKVPVSSAFGSGASSPPKKFNPSKEQLSKWEKQEVTEKQVYALRKLGLSDIEIEQFNKKTAFEYINKKK